jgi:hypothetical protein
MFVAAGALFSLFSTGNKAIFFISKISRISSSKKQLQWFQTISL